MTFSRRGQPVTIFEVQLVAEAAIAKPDRDTHRWVLLARQIGVDNLAIVDQVRQAIAEHGIYIPIYERDKDGAVVLDPRTVKIDESTGKETGDPMIFDMKLNPALMALTKFIDSMGINFAELMATPRARQKLTDDDEAAGGLASAIGKIFQRAGAKLGAPAQRSVLEHED